MPLIKSISGIRGTLENIPGESLSDYDVKQFTLAYLEEIILYESSKTILVGRDARKSGKRISNIIIDVVLNEGYNVIDLGLVTTPTIGIAVKKHKTAGAIMISASHNDEKWNALKLLNSSGEFLHPEEVQNFINKNNIASKSIAVAVDGINSVGGVAIPKFLESLGIKKIKKINCNPDGNFNHNPEPLPENITDLCSEMKRGKYQLGIVVDPDADRLVLVDERGEPFGEEYTLVAAAEYLLSKNHGASTCSNLSSTLALKNITEKYGGKYFSSAVGEINVVKVMKEKKCLIGGEGNGGVIYPMTHYGRDSLIGIGLIISLLVERNISLSELKKELPEYNIFKTKLNYKGEISSIISDVKKLYDESLIDTTDGVKINFSNSWIHIRKSNTEPVIRIISEASSMLEAEKICKEIMSKLRIV